MRIIRGTHRGRQITAPANLPVRPTTDMAKESLFNILENHIYFDDLNVLDLYAGTGSISYEFASRGSHQVIAVDINQACIKFIGDMAKKMGFEQLRAVRSSSFAFINHITTKFDLVFADPPYDLEGIEEIIELIFKKDIIAEKGWLIVEHGEDKDFSAFPHFFQHRNYGKVNFTFFRK
jgi:16S rRNA (guanine966-N2)-methyltransferase